MALRTVLDNLIVAGDINQKVECIETQAKSLYAGTSSGALLVYQQVPLGVEGDYTYELSQINRGFSKKAVLELVLFDEGRLLLSLSDSLVSVHDAVSFAPVHTLLASRGSSTFDLAETPTVLESHKRPLLCCAIRRKISIFQWDREDASFVELKELAIPDTPKVVRWVGRSVVVGFKREYNIINVQTGLSIETSGPGKSPQPVVAVIDGKEIILVKDSSAFFYGEDGKQTRKYSIKFSEPPSCIGVSSPYVIGLVSKGVEVAARHSRAVVHSLFLPNGQSLLFRGNNQIFFFSSNSIHRLIPRSLLSQADELASNDEYEEALMLCAMAQSDEGIAAVKKAQEMHRLYAHHLFQKGDHYADAVHQFECVNNFDPREVMSLFPPNIYSSEKSNNADVRLSGSSLISALLAAIPFLQQHRSTTAASEGEDNELARALDTFMLKAFLITKQGEKIRQLIEGNNRIDIESAQEFLIANNAHLHLVHLYKAKKDHEKALDLLESLHKNGSGDSSPSKGSNAISPGKIVEEAVEYLQFLGKSHQALVLQHAKWIIGSDPEAGLHVFTHADNKDPIAPDVVMDYLKTTKGGMELRGPFLEHVIYDRQDTSTGFNDDLVMIYLDSILRLKKLDSKKGTKSDAQHVGILRKKLIMFLERSKHYTPQKMLSKFPSDDLYEERAILLSRLGQHEQALNIHARVLNNPKAAEDYCQKNYDKEDDQRKDVYLALLRVYLKPHDKTSPLIKPALELMRRHYKVIDASKALLLLPDETLATDIQDYLEVVLRSTQEARRNNQVVRNVLKTENLQVREQLLRYHSRTVHITSERMCPVCNKRIGSSVFNCYPNGTVVHFMCAKDKLVCPVTGERFQLV